MSSAPAPPAVAGNDSLDRRFVALRNPVYLRYLGGQIVSLAGTQMQVVAQAWLVYRLTNSASWLGIISFTSNFFAFVISPFAGAIADHADRRRLLIAIETSCMAQAFLLAGIAAFGHIQVWHLICLSVMLGLNNGAELTVRQAMALDLVGRRDLPSAIRLNSATNHGSRILGPMLAGLLVEPLGEAFCFFLNGLTFLAVIYSLIRMPATQARVTDPLRAGAVFAKMREGARYVIGRRDIMRPMLVGTFLFLVGFTYPVIFPVIARDVYGGGAPTLARLTSMIGLGAVIGILFGGRESAKGIDFTLRFNVWALGASFLLLAWTVNIWVSMVAGAGVGYFLLGSSPVINNYIQANVDESVRGRVLSLYLMMLTGAIPFGALSAGWSLDRFGVTPTLIALASLCFAAGLTLWFRPGAYQSRDTAGRDHAA